jgi:hypothetical protein
MHACIRAANIHSNIHAYSHTSTDTAHPHTHTHTLAHTSTHTRAHTPTHPHAHPRTHKHTHARAHTHAHTHARTHTHPHTLCVCSCGKQVQAFRRRDRLVLLRGAPSSKQTNKHTHTPNGPGGPAPPLPHTAERYRASPRSPCAVEASKQPTAKRTTKQASEQANCPARPRSASRPDRFPAKFPPKFPPATALRCVAASPPVEVERGGGQAGPTTASEMFEVSAHARARVRPAGLGLSGNGREARHGP